uniref:Uncharacterized protein n=1 Tax=Helicobacter pylori TaxID=210 RepID=A0A0D3RKU4_HELPX|nr:hypothetical protein [Helicobacter pylori]
MMLPVGRVWFSLCIPIVGILQSLSSNAFPTGLTHHISKSVTLRTSCARYECMGILYHELVAFIPNAKDDWDFCLGGLKGAVVECLCVPLVLVLLWGNIFLLGAFMSKRQKCSFKGLYFKLSWSKIKLEFCFSSLELPPKFRGFSLGRIELVSHTKKPIGNCPLTLSKVSAGTINPPLNSALKTSLNFLKLDPCKFFNFEKLARITPFNSL